MTEQEFINAIKDKTDDQLKVLIYDTSVVLKQTQREVQIMEAVLNQRKTPEPKPVKKQTLPGGMKVTGSTKKGKKK